MPRVGGPVGLWAGFLDRMPTAEAVACVRDLERLGIGTIWLQEYSGVDPFVRSALYLAATTELRVALGVAVIHARDAEAMVAVATTLESAYPGRFVLGLGVSHRALVEARGHSFGPPIATMASYLDAMDARVGKRAMPTRILGALGPRMVELAGIRTDGVHTYFCPVAHTGTTREAIGPDRWLAPTQMVALSPPGTGWHDGIRPYLALCLGMPNYTRNLRRFGFDDKDLATTSDALIDALCVPDEAEAVQHRLASQRRAGADQVVIQLVPPPPARAVVDRLARGLLEPTR